MASLNLLNLICYYQADVLGYCHVSDTSVNNTHFIQYSFDFK